MGNKLVELLSALTFTTKKICDDILLLNFTVVNACVIGTKDNWVLVDTGLENSAEHIIESVEMQFGKNARPNAIILTHGHFDHVGSAKKLCKMWDVMAYIHELELPYVTGKEDYPLADPSTDEGLVAKLSPTFPHSSIDLGFRAVALPADGGVPGIKGWKWVHTPGHTKGHISLFRESQRVLIAGDAFSTTKQESLWSMLTHQKRISGPPKYLTTDFSSAEDSVRILRDLEPCLAIPSHGEMIKGDELRRYLEYLTVNFKEIAKPDKGRYVSS